MLIGRDAECARLDALLRAARAGESGVLVVRGDIGSGKSALLAHAAERADGFTVLATRPVESESELPFAGLADLLRPVTSHLDAVPAPQAAALAGALAIGPAVEGDRFAVCAATLGVLAAAAEERPLLTLVDGVQWLDASSLQALVFAARRLESEAVAVVFAVREGPATALDAAGFDEIRLDPLADAAARALVGDAENADRLVALAAGNPLALVELPRLLTAEQLSAAEPRGALDHAFRAELNALPDDARRLLTVVAASDTGNVAEALAAAESLGLDPRALDLLEDAGVLTVEHGQARFRHPLLRMTAYRAAPAAARRAAHRALAGEDDDRRAWHLAAAADQRDGAAAGALAEAGRNARARGAHAEAAAAFERAAALGATGERAGWLRSAAEEAWLAGRVDRARELLENALADASDAPARARIQHLRGAIHMWHAAPAAAARLLAEEAALVEEDDPARAARMLTDAAWASFMAGDITGGRAVAERAGPAGRRAGGAADVLARAALGIALVLGGEAERAVPLLSDYSSAALPERPLRPDGQVLTWFERYDEAREVLTRTVDEARAVSALGALPYALACLADVEFRTGRWVAGRAAAAEAVRIAGETEQSSTLAFALSCLSRFDAAQGRAEECVDHARRAQAIGEQRFGAVVAYALAALGLLELGLGRPSEAARQLELLGRQVAERGLREPNVVQWEPDLVEAYVRDGRDAEAASTLESFERIATETGRSWALAAAARCRGLLAADDEFDLHFETALELHTTPFERARTELCLGERRRRARRRSEARAPLRSALEAFELLGASPWAERARAELAACGETVQQRDSAGEELTPQELQVALVVARGATNKEAGAALFLSPKTIETHLGRVYRKLGVRTRTELAALLARDGSLTSS